VAGHKTECAITMVVSEASLIFMAWLDRRDREPQPLSRIVPAASPQLVSFARFSQV